MPSPPADGRANNFDLLRLIAALSVIFSHAFLIAEGTQAREPFLRFTGDQCILGLVGVFVFFAISGYLVTASYCTTPAPARFALRRAARLYPGLLVNAALCVFALGPLVTALPLSAYLADPQLHTFLANALTLSPGPYQLPGVQFIDNQVGHLVNGSLWTLRYEAMMYAMVLVLGLIRLLRAWVAVALVVAGIAAVRFETALTGFGDFGEWAWLLGFFASGMAIYAVRDRLAWRGRYALLALAALALFAWAGQFIMLFPLAGAYLAIWFARRYDGALDYARNCGDLSYGLYIYGWPAEALVAWLAGGRAAWWAVFLGGLALALPLSWLSWHLVEKPALRWSRRRAAPAAAAPRPLPA